MQKTPGRMWPFMAVMAIFACFSGPSDAIAQDSAINNGDTAWILTSSALVLFMTIPGLALFYGGLVRVSNVLSVLMHCYVIACLSSVIWLVCGYGLAFGNGGALNDIIGGLDKAFLAGIGPDSLRGTIPEYVFFIFQMTFAIITPGLIVGAYVERMRFPVVLFFSAVWLVVVYVPVCHWVWGGGWLADLGVMDFAGGIVVHVTAGVSALVAVALLGNRQGFPDDVKPPHNSGMVMIGASMLWVGWFGFNAGSALAADGNAALAMTVTQISAATASLVWMTIEWLKFGKPSLIGLVTGTIAGLATITPASGYVGPAAALFIGAVAGIVCFFMVGVIKTRFKLDDTLDVFAVHGMGGALGTLLTGFLVSSVFGGVGLPEGRTIIEALGVQVLGIAIAVLWAAFASYVILKIAHALFRLRVTDEQEFEGLDITVHGERGYEL